jgi:hypothetical protein
MCGGEEKWMLDFWWGKMSEIDRLKDEQIESNELCRRTDPSLAKP